MIRSEIPDSFAATRARLGDISREVLIDLAVHGPCTARQLAAASRRDILTIRPRITDLLKLGLVVSVEPSLNHLSPSNRERQGAKCRATIPRENFYRVATQDEWEQFHAQLTEEITTNQMQFA